MIDRLLQLRAISVSLAILTAMLATACGGDGEAPSSEGRSGETAVVGSLLELVPRGADTFTLADMESVREERLNDLEDQLADLVKADELDDWGIDLDDVDSIIVSELGSADALTILRGDLSVEDVEDALDDARFRDDTYRDVTVWTERGGNAAVAIVGGDVVVIGEEDRVEESIDVFKDGGRSMGQDDEVASAVESLGDVLVYSVADDCSYRGCRKWATGLRAENRELVTAYGFVFRNEDGASDAERDVEDDLEDWIDSPVVSVDGVVVVASSPMVEGEFSLGRRGSLIYAQRPDPTPTAAPPATAVPDPTPTAAPPATAVPDPTPTAAPPATAVPDPTPTAAPPATAVPDPTAAGRARFLRPISCKMAKI